MEQSLLALTVQVNGHPLREYLHQGQFWIEGRKGSEFSLQLRNKSYMQRILVVASIDGLSIMDGKQAHFASSGYVLEPRQTALIPGWRLNDLEAARFRFHKAAKSYAAKEGRPANIGVIGCAVFEEFKEPAYIMGLPDCNLHANVSYRTSPIANSPVSKECVFSSSTDFLHGAQASSGTTCDWYSISESAAAQPEVAPSLGTEFGQKIQNPVANTAFNKTSNTPKEMHEIRYADREELRRRGIDITRKPIPAVQNPSAFPGEQGCKPPAGWTG
jgi:hypothetical protein